MNSRRLNRRGHFGGSGNGIQWVGFQTAFPGSPTRNHSAVIDDGAKNQVLATVPFALIPITCV